MSKKPHKVEETAAPYAAKKAAQPAGPAAKPENPGQIRYIDPESARKFAEKIFKEHDELFRKLAQ